VTEQTNFNNVDYVVTNPSGAVTRSQTVSLAGGGKSTTVTFKFKTTNTNINGGQIVSRVTLSVSGATLSAPTEKADLMLTVTDPMSVCDTCTPQQICYANACISPIVIDTVGDGLDLTDAQDGVNFDITTSGTKMRISWTAADSDEAWLVLDRNANGVIDDA